jgi:hypothetical protein
MMKVFGYTTTAIVMATIILMILVTAAGGATLDQCVAEISGIIGMWLDVLLCVIVNKVRGKPAGGLTLFLTCWSWLAFIYHVIGPFVGGFVRGHTAAGGSALSAIVFGLVFIAGSFALYFIPAIVAGIRHHRDGMAIFKLNLYLGWTFVGWGVALVWACTADHLLPAWSRQ